MQHLLRSIYNNRWFPFQTIPLSSSPKPSSSLLVPLSPSEPSSSPINQSIQPSLVPTNPDHQLQLSSSDTRLITNQFHLLQITSTSLSISVSLPSSHLSNQLVHPTIHLNSQPCLKFLLLEDQTKPTKNSDQQISHSEEDHTSVHPSSLTSIMILIYGLESGTLYDIDIELTLLDQHSALGLASNSSVRSRNHLDDNDQDDIAQKLDSSSTLESEPNEQALVRRHSQRLKATEPSTTTRTPIGPTDPDGPPPPYTSYDPASPTQTCTSDVVGSSSHSFSSFDSSFADLHSPESSADTSTPRSANPNEEEYTLRLELEKQALALSEAIEENAPLKKNLDDLERLVKRLDEENMNKSAELLNYDEPIMVQLEKKIEEQKQELKRKTDEWRVLEEKNQEKIENLKQNNQNLKTRWEDNLEKVGEFKEKILKPIEVEIEELNRQVFECEKEIKSIDRENERQAVEDSNEFQVVRSKSSSKRNQLTTSVVNNSRGCSHQSTHTHQGYSKNHQKSKWRSMDDFKFINPCLGRRSHSTHPTKRAILGDETGDHPKLNDTTKRLVGSVGKVNRPTQAHKNRAGVEMLVGHTPSDDSSSEKRNKDSRARSAFSSSAF